MLACLYMWWSLIQLQSLCCLCLLPGFHMHQTLYQFHCPEIVSPRLSDLGLQNWQCPMPGHRLILRSSFTTILGMPFLSLLCQSFLYLQYPSILVYNFALSEHILQQLLRKNPREAKILPFGKSHLLGIESWLLFLKCENFHYYLLVSSDVKKSMSFCFTILSILPAFFFLVKAWESLWALLVARSLKVDLQTVLKFYFYPLCWALNGTFSLQTHALYFWEFFPNYFLDDFLPSVSLVLSFWELL